MRHRKYPAAKNRLSIKQRASLRRLRAIIDEQGFQIMANYSELRINGTRRLKFICLPYRGDFNVRASAVICGAAWTFFPKALEVSAALTDSHLGATYYAVKIKLPAR